MRDLGSRIDLKETNWRLSNLYVKREDIWEFGAADAHLVRSGIERHSMSEIGSMKPGR